MEKKHKRCQSCGMPFKKDPQGGGTNVDGSKSTTYCSYCFVEGEFQGPDNVEGMHQLVQDKLMEAGMPKFLSKIMAKDVYRLQRWKN